MNFVEHIYIHTVVRKVVQFNLNNVKQNNKSPTNITYYYIDNYFNKFALIIS
jgi:hypothetical protein